MGVCGRRVSRGAERGAVRACTYLALNLLLVASRVSLCDEWDSDDWDDIGEQRRRRVHLIRSGLPRRRQRLAELANQQQVGRTSERQDEEVDERRQRKRPDALIERVAARERLHLWRRRGGGLQIHRVIRPCRRSRRQ